MPEPRNIMSWTCRIAVAITVGCGGASDRQPPDGMPDGSIGDAPAPGPMAVHGRSARHCVTERGVVDLPNDLSTTRFTSYTPTASGVEPRTATGAADGTFQVLVGGGAAAWQLQIGERNPLFLVGNSLVPDLSAFELGRCDRALPTRPTTLTMTVNGLEAWEANDKLQLVSQNAGVVVVGEPFQGVVAVGDTAITAKTIPWEDLLIDAGKGDIVAVSQLTSRTPPIPEGTPYLAIARSGQAIDFTIVDGGSASMTVNISGGSLSRELTIYVNRPMFEGFRAQVGPGAQPSTPAEQSFTIAALPQTRQRGAFANAPHLVELTPRPDNTLPYFQTFRYVAAFATAGVLWDRFAIVHYNFAVPVLAAGATTAASLEAGFEAMLPVEALEVDGTIAPSIAPVRNVKIAGMDLGTPRSGVGRSPTITWDAPELGKPTDYTVRILSVTADASTTKLEPIATFVTTVPALQVPDAVVSTGGSYLLEISANATPGSARTAAPHLAGLPSVTARSVTAQFMP